MDIVSLLSSFNIISLVAFIITLGFIVYQFYLLRKETKSQKKGKVVIPEFKETKGPMPTSYTKVIAPVNQAAVKKQSMLPLIVGIGILLVLFVLISLNIFNGKTGLLPQVTSTRTPTPIVNLVASKGIRLYNQNWSVLSDIDATKLQPGQTIIIGIETIPGATDIDSARIRVNRDTWQTSDITLNFNTANRVYYKDYTIATGTASLKIEAQLHSKVDGWLGL